MGDGRVVRLRRDWRACGKLYALTGENWTAAIDRALRKQDGESLELIAKAIVISAEAADGPPQDVTVDYVMRDPPALSHVSDAFRVLANLFYVGVPDLMPEPDEEEDKKPKAPLANSTFWEKYGDKLLRRVFRHASSGGSRAPNQSHGYAPAATRKPSAA